MLKPSLIERAAKIAVTAHAGQVRKGDSSPYVAHPFMVALMLVRHGFSDTVVAAALVHDVLEDTGFTEEKMREALGDEVTDIVKTVSEDKSLVWEERKEKYLETVRHGSPEAKAVSLADKIHNLESILTAHTSLGPAVWERFKRGKEKKLELEEKMLAMFKEYLQHPMLEEYERLVEKLRQVESSKESLQSLLSLFLLLVAKGISRAFIFLDYFFRY